MWKCPKCGALLVQRNMSHSCGNYTVEEFLKNKPERGRELFWFFVNEFRKIGPVILHPVKTRVALMVEVRFAAINHVSHDHIRGHFWLKESIASDKFYKIEHLSKSAHIHHFRLYNESEMDEEFRGLMQMAYAVGERRHIRAADIHGR